MATTKLLLSIFFYYLAVSVAVDQQTRRSETRLREPQQCRFQRVSSSKPSERIQSEGGVTEMWNEEEDQFQCAGVAAMRHVVEPNGLSLPNFHPVPRLAYVVQGRGLLGLNFPGCAETYHSQHSGQEETAQQRQGSGRDQHQKVTRVNQGDVIAIPAGVTHWCYNDGNEQLIVVAVHDLKNQENQLDQRSRSFFLAGRAQRQGQRGERQQDKFENIFRALDSELLAEAFNVPTDLIRKMQREDNRGIIVNVEGKLSVIRPDEGTTSYEEEEQRREGGGQNGLEETFCTMRVTQNINNRRVAEVYSRQAGRISVVNENQLPILRYMDMSVERGTILQNAMHAPHWSMNSHRVVYVVRGEAQVQIVRENGQCVLDETVRQGSMFVIPQHYTSMARAGQNGFEYVSFKTSSQPMKSPLVGYTSVMRAMPLEVITKSYQVNVNEAQNLKLNRGQHTFLLPPSGRSSYN